MYWATGFGVLGEIWLPGYTGKKCCGGTAILFVMFIIFSCLPCHIHEIQCYETLDNFVLLSLHSLKCMFYALLGNYKAEKLRFVCIASFIIDNSFLAI